MRIEKTKEKTKVTIHFIKKMKKKWRPQKKKRKI